MGEVIRYENPPVSAENLQVANEMTPRPASRKQILYIDVQIVPSRDSEMLKSHSVQLEIHFV